MIHYISRRIMNKFFIFLQLLSRINQRPQTDVSCIDWCAYFVNTLIQLPIMSSSEYSYNAPQYYANLEDATTSTDDEDDFFDAKGPNVKPKEEDGKQKDLLETDEEDKENVGLPDEESLNDSFSKIKLKSKFEGIDLTPQGAERKSHPMLTRQDVSILSPKLSIELRTRSVLKDVWIKEGSHATNKKRKAEGSLCQGNSVAKYRSLAEAIYHFQRDTPPRFRGVSKKSTGFRFSHEPAPRASVTMPETPHFLSQNRLRHCSDHCLTAEERELEEIEKAKQQFKPQQLNKRIFEPPQELLREKTFTVPKPFNLSKPLPKKPEEVKDDIFIFKAKPMPRKIYASMDNLRVSFNKLPILMEEGEGELDDECSSICRGFKEAKSSNKTIVKPFSFDERDKLIAKRKLQKINKIIEEEKKATTFKAQPLPSYLHENNSTVHSSTSSIASSHHKHEMEEIMHEFKARPADVLHQKPFQVRKSERLPTKVLDVKLNTELRSHHRLEFDKLLKAHQEEREKYESEVAKKEELRVQDEVTKLRKELVHKPLPLPTSCRSKKYSSQESLDSNSSNN